MRATDRRRELGNTQTVLALSPQNKTLLGVCRMNFLKENGYRTGILISQGWHKEDYISSASF